MKHSFIAKQTSKALFEETVYFLFTFNEYIKNRLKQVLNLLKNILSPSKNILDKSVLKFCS